MQTRPEMIFMFMAALASNENFKPTKEDVDKIYMMSCLLADKYLENA